MKVNKKIKVGVLFVLSAVVLYWGVNFLKGSDVFTSHTVLYGVYDNTQGLNPGRPVTINGNNVGIVNSIDFTPDYSGTLLVTFQITTDYPIPNNAKATIVSDVLGNKTVELNINGLDYLGDAAVSGDTLPTFIQPGLTEAVNEQLAPLKAKTEKLLGSLDTALAVFQGFLTKETQSDFRNSFANLNESFENLRSITHEANVYLVSSRPKLQNITSNLDNLTSTLNANRGRLDTIFSNLASLSDTLAKARIAETMSQLAVASKQANEILLKVNNGEGTLGQLLNDPELYHNLTSATAALDRLLLDLRYNPNRYVEFSIFGSSPRYSQEEIDQLEEQRLKEREAATQEN
ncbi:mammalian cell entry protein [Phaeocystidibacter marisrubri]|nr:mammalian cell entry protein [Phaeocystidibacter marisrubri]